MGYCLGGCTGNHPMATKYADGMQRRLLPLLQTGWSTVGFAGPSGHLQRLYEIAISERFSDLSRIVRRVPRPKLSIAVLLFAQRAWSWRNRVELVPKVFPP